jgi:hypothetical protein
MKLFITGLLTIVLIVPAFAGYNYTITSGYKGTLWLENNDILLMTGGGINSLTGADNSTLNISNTSPLAENSGGIWTLDLGGSSQLSFSGGQVYQMTVGGYATAVLSGGRIDEIWGYYFYPANPEHIRVYCQSGWTYQNGYLSGQWLDNSAFNIKLVTKSGSDVFSNMTIIPEPATMLLLAVGSLLIRKNN